MADNYLERQMEDLASGRLRSGMRKLVAKSSGKQLPKGKMAGRSFVIIGGVSVEGEQLAGQYRRLGATVDIIDAESRRGYIIAQKLGVKYYPCPTIDDSFINERLEQIKSQRKCTPEIIDLRVR